MPSNPMRHTVPEHGRAGACRALQAAARPIPPCDRDGFLRDVAAELARYPELGPGIIARVTAKLQRQHLAPRLSNNSGKWNR